MRWLHEQTKRNAKSATTVTQRKSKFGRVSLWNVEYEFLIFNLLFSLQSNAIVESFLGQNLFGAHVSERELKR